MPSNKVLAGVSYFSVFFAPLLIPVIIYFVSDNREVRFHAKRSFISHLIPAALLIIAFLAITFSMLSFNGFSSETPSTFHFWQLAPVIFMFVYGLLLLFVMVWNVFQGIKVLK